MRRLLLLLVLEPLLLLLGATATPIDPPRIMVPSIGADRLSTEMEATDDPAGAAIDLGRSAAKPRHVTGDGSGEAIGEDIAVVIDETVPADIAIVTDGTCAGVRAFGMERSCIGENNLGKASRCRRHSAEPYGGGVVGAEFIEQKWYGDKKA